MMNTEDQGTATDAILCQELAEVAERILSLGPICDSCLGRQFAMLSTGLTNVERGRAVKTFLSMVADLSPNGSPLLLKLAPSHLPARLRLGQEDMGGPCWVCLGQMERERLEALAKKAVSALKDYQYSTILVGTRMSGLLAENEELLLADGGSRSAEPFKSELNREVGKIISQMTGKQADLKSPDITVHLNLERDDVDLQVASLFICGRYRKLVRGIPQTRWPCRECGGSGCPRCNNTGRMYPESVDEILMDPVIEATRAVDTVFHGAGREDIDALMLGTGRPFVVEARNPMIRKIDLNRLKDEINSAGVGKVEVGDLSLVGQRKVEELKMAAFEKTYSALVAFSKPVEEEKLKSILIDLVGAVQQRTPTRVAHRRADKIRTREVFRADLDQFWGDAARLILRCEGGLYIKELISGDGGRTKPSLAELLGLETVVRELDVINVGGESNGQVTRDTEEDQV